MERVTPNLCINYGTNEAGNISRASPHFLKDHFDSVGLPSPDAEIVFLGTQGEKLYFGQEGMIVVRSQSVIDCYQAMKRLARQLSTTDGSELAT